MSDLSRRTFLHSAGAGLAASTLLMNRAQAAHHETVRHAVVGLGGQGHRHALGFAANDDCEVIAVCDLDPKRRDRTAAELVKRNHKKPESVEDFRTLLDRDDIDTISIATPDHWHTPVALAALAAGKPVYVEKPCSHTLEEGRLLTAAAAKTGLCVQHGTQSRSGAGIRDAMQFLRDGGIGTVRMAKAINHQMRGAIGRTPDAEPPRGVNYDLWLGPAPERPFSENRWHYKWHWHWDYGTGDMGNDGVHQIDVARWALGKLYPKQASAMGGQLFYDDDHETPDTQVVTFDYGDCYLLYEMRLWTKYKMDGHDNGVMVYGDNGTLEVGRNGCEVTLLGEEKKKIGEGSDWDANVRNFLDCVKANNPEGLNAPIAEGAASSALCHIGNIATRLGGRSLTIDPATGGFNDEEANALRTKEYRKGYELATV
jgi:predicted dehydrogenase